MSDLYTILGGLAGIIAALFAAVVWGGSKANDRRDAEEAKRKHDTYRKATEAKHEVDRMSDDAVLERLRDRAGK